MNVLVNLLPDTRQTKLRDRKRRQLATGIAVLIWVVCGIIILLLTLFMASQKLIIGDLSRKIDTKKTEIQGISGLTDALTAQQHLDSLPKLYDKRVYMTKFLDALSQSDPLDITLSSLTVDETNTLSISGTGRTYTAVAKLARALEAQNVTIGTSASPSNTPYFTNVTIKSAGRTTDSISFTLNATVDSGVTNGSK